MTVIYVVLAALALCLFAEPFGRALGIVDIPRRFTAARRP